MIREFQGEYAFLSNFWMIDIKFEGFTYPSVEHAYQAAKSIDPVWRSTVLTTRNPGLVKRLSRKQNIKKDWNDIKLDVMEKLLRYKFTNKQLQLLLLKTGDQELQEGNLWKDLFWGVDLTTGKGQNYLGKLLMKIRQELKNKSKK